VWLSSPNQPQLFISEVCTVQ